MGECSSNTKNTKASCLRRTAALEKVHGATHTSSMHGKCSGHAQAACTGSTRDIHKSHACEAHEPVVLRQLRWVDPKKSLDSTQTSIRSLNLFVFLLFFLLSFNSQTNLFICINLSYLRICKKRVQLTSASFSIFFFFSRNFHQLAVDLYAYRSLRSDNQQDII